MSKDRIDELSIKYTEADIIDFATWMIGFKHPEFGKQAIKVLFERYKEEQKPKKQQK